MLIRTLGTVVNAILLHILECTFGTKCPKAGAVLFTVPPTANPLLLQYANNRIEELDTERQKQLKLVTDLTANSVSSSQIESISGYLENWDEVSFDDKRRVVDTLTFFAFRLSAWYNLCKRRRNRYRSARQGFLTKSI